MLNTSIGSISGLFKGKKEDDLGLEDINVDRDQAPSSKEEKEAEKDQSGAGLLLNEEEEFEKEISQLSISLDEQKECTPASVPQEDISSSKEESDAVNEVLRLKRILALKEEIRAREKERERETAELKVLEMIKIQAQLEYERKQRKLMVQEMQSIRKRLEDSELECMELIKYCKLLLSQKESE